MSRWRPNTYSLGVGGREMAVVDLSGQGAARVVSMLPLEGYLPGAQSPESADWEPSMATVMAQTEIKTGGSLHVTIADDWARYWLVSPPAGVRSLDELRALAATRFEQLYGGSIEGWTLMADWNLRGASLVCALPSRLLSSMHSVCSQYLWRIESIQPQAVRLMNAHRGRIGKHAWVCCFGGSSFMAALLENGEFRHARQFRFDTLPGAEEVLLRLETELLRVGSDMPPEICLLGKGPDLRGQTSWHGSHLSVLNDTAQRSVLTGSGTRSASDASLLAVQGGGQ